MNKMFLAFLLAGFVFSAFADYDSVVTDLRSRINVVTIVSFAEGSTNYVFSTRQGSYNFDTVYSAFFDAPLAVQCRNVLQHPDLSISATSTLDHISIDFPFRSTSNVREWFSVNLVPQVAQIYAFAFSLYSTYNPTDSSSLPPGFSNFQRVGVNRFFNFRLSHAIVGCLGSTNSVWRSSVLNFLSSFSSSLSGIGSSVNSINQDYRAVNAVALDPSSVFDTISSPDLFGGDAGEFLRRSVTNNSPRSAALASAISSYDAERVKAILSAFYSGVTTASGSPVYGFELSDLLMYPQYGQSAIDFTSLSGNFSRFDSNQVVRMGHLTNTIDQTSKSIISNARGLFAELMQSRTNKTDNPLYSQYGVGVGDVVDGMANAQVSIADNLSDIADSLSTMIVDNGTDVGFNIFLPDDIKVEFAQIQGGISDQTEKLSDMDGTLREWFRYWYHLFGYDSAVGVSALNFITDSDVGLPYYLNRLSYRQVTSNQVDLALSNLTNFLANSSNDISSVLLDDYKNFIDSGRFSDVVSRYASIDPGFDSFLSDLGYDETSDNYGRWWNLKTSFDYTSSLFAWSNAMLSASINSNMMSNFDSVLSAFNTMTSSVPDSAALVSRIDSMARDVENSFSSFEYVTNSLVSISNAFEDVNTLYSSSDIPSEITFFRLSDSVQFTVSTSPLRTAFDLMHYGLAFCYSLVAILFFPKFLLFMFNVFFKLFNRFLVLHKSS